MIKHKTTLNGVWAVILCGGYGSRMGSLTKNLPKPLIEVHNEPILWYVIQTLRKYGIKNIILPLGYGGDIIKNYVLNNFNEDGLNIHCIDSGIDSSISTRINIISDVIPEKADFLLVNGDTIFDFNMEAMYKIHKSSGCLLTLASGEIISPWGLILVNDKRVKTFSREEKIRHLTSKDGLEGYVYSGISFINKDALQYINLDECDGFEETLFSSLIKNDKVSRYVIDGDWFAVDTPKDLKNMNQLTGDKNRGLKIKSIKEKLTPTEKILVNRYKYESPYVDDFDKFKQDIIDKKIIPHQVEVQPGPLHKKLCWLDCPYCYGKSAMDSGERLDKDRYVEILKEITVGGCNKVIFAGWATDPLNYKYIDDLVQTSIDGGSIVGFNTRAIKVSDRLIELLNSESVVPKSYMSISVNAGTNRNYNKVNGVKNEDSLLYDKVLKNVEAISSYKSGYNIDISATYLINQHTCSVNEVKKFISDFKNAGCNLLRFSCPQIPRGDDKENNFIPSSEEYRRYIKDLFPIIEEQDETSCRAIVVENDDIFLSPRVVPCYARFIYPTIGFDGWLYHCSQSSGSNFKNMALGNLATQNFWDIFYNYDAENMGKYISDCSVNMETNDCRCDRKEHVVNTTLGDKINFLNR